MSSESGNQAITFLRIENFFFLLQILLDYSGELLPCWSHRNVENGVVSIALHEPLDIENIAGKVESTTCFTSSKS